MKRTWSSLACALLLCLALLPATASADSGPKPVLTITVKNTPEGVYYLDLITQDSVVGGLSNLDWNRGGPYDEALLAGLHAWEDEGWYPAFAGGTKAPLFGDLVPGADGAHSFTYFGLPTTFRIAVSSASGAQAAEEPFTRTAFYTNLTYDYAANEIVESTPSWAPALLQFLFTLVPTLVVEGLLLLAFGFRWKENWLVFLLANLATQFGLHAALGGAFVTISSHFLFYLLVLAVPELITFAVEAAVYAKLLKGRTPRRRVLYALTANAASLLLGFLPLEAMAALLRGL